MPEMAEKPFRLIADQQALVELCDDLSTSSEIALDTEFVRTRTLLPKLGLLQVSDGNQTYLIDPLEISDFSPFVALLTDATIVKVLHACSEDLEVFWSHFNVVPSPVFDTQLAANVLGMGPTLGYARLVELECDVVLDKGESRTDWLARPLSDKQLHYAANDVIYLYTLYHGLAERIDELDKRSMLYSEIEILASKKIALLPPEYAYLTFGNAWKLHTKQRFVLKRLAKWRLEQARKYDIAINFIVKEPHLLAVAMHLPRTKSQLSGLKVLLPQEIRKQGDTLVGIVNQAINQFEQDPQLHDVPKIRRLNDVGQYKKQLAALKVLCTEIAEQTGIAVELLASKKQLNQLLKWWWFEYDETAIQGLKPDVLSGWRAPLFTERLIELLGQPVRGIGE